MNVKAQDQKQKVRETYGEIARTRDEKNRRHLLRPDMLQAGLQSGLQYRRD